MSKEFRGCHCGSVATGWNDAVANCRCNDIGEWISCDYCSEEIEETAGEPVGPFFDQTWHRECWAEALALPSWLGEETLPCDNCDMPVPG